MTGVLQGKRIAFLATDVGSSVASLKRLGPRWVMLARTRSSRTRSCCRSSRARSMPAITTCRLAAQARLAHIVFQCGGSGGPDAADTAIEVLE